MHLLFCTRNKSDQPVYCKVFRKTSFSSGTSGGKRDAFYHWCHSGVPEDMTEWDSSDAIGKQFISYHKLLEKPFCSHIW